MAFEGLSSAPPCVPPPLVPEEAALTGVDCKCSFARASATALGLSIQSALPVFSHMFVVLAYARIGTDFIVRATPLSLSLSSSFGLKGLVRPRGQNGPPFSQRGFVIHPKRRVPLPIVFVLRRGASAC